MRRCRVRSFYDPVSSASSEGQNFTTDGWGFVAALGAGQVFDLGARWSVEPEARLNYQHIASSGGADSYARIDFPGMNTGYGAVDARLNRSCQLGTRHTLSSRVEAGVLQSVGDGPRATFADLAGQDALAFSAAPGGTSAEMLIGIASHLTRCVSLAARFRYVRRLGSEYGETFGGGANIQVRF